MVTRSRRNVNDNIFKIKNPSTFYSRLELN